MTLLAEVVYHHDIPFGGFLGPVFLGVALALLWAAVLGERWTGAYSLLVLPLGVSPLMLDGFYYGSHIWSMVLGFSAGMLSIVSIFRGSPYLVTDYREKIAVVGAVILLLAVSCMVFVGVTIVDPGLP